MGIISMRLFDWDNTLIRMYLEMLGLEFSAFIRQAVIEKIENEYDLALFNQVWDEEISAVKEA